MMDVRSKQEGGSGESRVAFFGQFWDLTSDILKVIIPYCHSLSGGQKEK